MRGPGRTSGQRKDDAARKHSLDHRRRHAQRFSIPKEYGRRCFPRSARPVDERRSYGGVHQLSRRPIHLHRLSRLDRVSAGNVEHADRRRRRRRGGRARSCEGAHIAADAEAALRSRHSALPLRQQDRQGAREHARSACRLAAGGAEAAGVAAGSDLEGRRHHRLRRFGARPRLCLQGARAFRSHRNSVRRHRSQEGSALPDAGKARGLRRSLDGRIVVGHRTAA